MIFRQAVISIYPAIAGTPGEYKLMPDLDIVFRQPYHNFGLSFTFNFTKSFAVSMSICNITINNPSKNMISMMQFDTKTYYNRPKIEIWAGESEYKLLSNDALSVQGLKSSPGMSMVYTGYPIFFVENKFVGGKSLYIQLSDVNPPDASQRITKNFNSGITLIDLLTQISAYAHASWDLSQISSDPTFSSVVIPHSVIYTAKNIYAHVLPELSRLYGFVYNRMADGNLLFIPADYSVQGGNRGEISNLNGMIEYPTQINWVHWNVKTFYGRPFILYPQEWATFRASNLDGGFKQAMVVDATHNFNDDTAEIIYKISPNGDGPITNPIKVM